MKSQILVILMVAAAFAVLYYGSYCVMGVVEAGLPGRGDRKFQEGNVLVEYFFDED